MISFKVSAVVTDIEGTTTDIDFVHQVLFPYARSHLARFIQAQADTTAVREQLQATARMAQLSPDDHHGITRTLLRWIDEDRKFTPLKALQGLIWADGYRRGEFRGHVYPDAHTGLQNWAAAGIALYVYSSGSVAAQQLLFGHSAFGDLRPLFSGYFDTTTGPKRETASYQTIASALGHPAATILFLSDVVEELDAAAAAGLRCTQLLRSPDMVTGAHPTARSFSEIQLENIS